MKMVWGEEKLKEIFLSKNIDAWGDGDGARGACALCGCENSLRRLSDSYELDGVEESYDQLLFECFGVHSGPEHLICDSCVGQLRNTVNFRALVYAAFKTPNRAGSRQPKEELAPGITDGVPKASITELDEDPEYSHVYTKKDLLDIIQSSVVQKKPTKRRLFKKDSVVKKMIVTCTMCGQRYPMLLPVDASTSFVCSRCKLGRGEEQGGCKKCKLCTGAQLGRHHVELRGDLRGKCRLRSVPKDSSGTKVVYSNSKENGAKKKYNCSQCSKSFFVASNLAEHEKCVHGVSLECNICGKTFKTKDMLDKHMKIHTGQPLYECNLCSKVFKCKMTLQRHGLTHQNGGSRYLRI